MIHTQRDLDYNEVDASGMVGMILHELDPEIQRRRIRIKTHIKQPSRWVSDLVCNQLILKNLVGNAIQFADPGKKIPCIDINIHSGSKNVAIEVIDNGVGISQQEQANIGRPFFRASDQSRGIGLGLFLVKKLSEKLGASFALQSREGEGTMCAIEVPNLSGA
jgi:signal transduction histidine kinase